MNINLSFSTVKAGEKLLRKKKEELKMCSSTIKSNHRAIKVFEANILKEKKKEEKFMIRGKFQSNGCRSHGKKGCCKCYEIFIKSLTERECVHIRFQYESFSDYYIKEILYKQNMIINNIQNCIEKKNEDIKSCNFKKKEYITQIIQIQDKLQMIKVRHQCIYCMKKDSCISTFFKICNKHFACEDCIEEQVSEDCSECKFCKAEFKSQPCIVCTNIFEKYESICDNGHDICFECLSQVKQRHGKCPMCRGNLII